MDLLFHRGKATLATAHESMQKWYEKVKAFANDSFNTAADTICDREDEVLNYFINRATNASAESLNSNLDKNRDFYASVI